MAPFYFVVFRSVMVINEDEVSESYLRRLRNLKKFRGWEDEAIKTYLKNRPPKPEVPVAEEPETTASGDVALQYDKEFKGKLKLLQKEYSVDMNDANDAESLRSLVRHMLQMEAIDKQIRAFYESKSTNTKALKDLGDYQRSLQTSIVSLQEQLGISRKIRKEKNSEDIPKYIENLQDRAMDFWNRKTTPVTCPKDGTELIRIWINFPKLNNKADFELECWKCHEMIIYAI